MKKVITVVATLVFVLISIVLLGGCGESANSSSSKSTLKILREDEILAEQARAQAQHETYLRKYEMPNCRQIVSLELQTNKGWEKIADMSNIVYIPTTPNPNDIDNYEYATSGDLSKMIDLSEPMRLVVQWQHMRYAKIVQQEIIVGGKDWGTWYQGDYNSKTLSTDYNFCGTISGITVRLAASPQARINVIYSTDDSAWKYLPYSVNIFDKAEKIIFPESMAMYVKDGKFSINVLPGDYIIETSLSNGLVRKDEIHVQNGESTLKVKIPIEVIGQK